jgi:hypothetical protein
MPIGGSNVRPRKIANLVETHGDRAYQAVAEAIAQSVGTDRPIAYFSKSVVIKFKKLGWWHPKPYF